VELRSSARIARQFVYDHAPLEAHIDKVIDTDDCKLEVVSVNAAISATDSSDALLLDRGWCR
jgi:hypothetical protein